MKKTIFCAGIAAVFLSACGGGGGGAATTATSGNGSTGNNDGSNTNTGTGTSTGATTPAAISLLTPAGASAASLTTTGDVVNDSFAYANAMRAQLGLPALKYVSAVGVAALNHAKNMQDTGIVGHYEVAGQPDYTGVTPSDRVAAAGYNTNSTGEIAAGFPGTATGFASSTQAIDGLFDAPFHRSIYLFDTTGVGMGDVTTTDPLKYSTFVADFVDYVASTPDNKLVAYPYDGQTNVKPQWQAIETPNPIAKNHPELAGKYVGYPITLSAAGNGAFSNVVFTITDAAGNNVPCDETDNSNSDESTRLAVCVSPTVLADNTTYKVAVTGSLTNTSIMTATPFSVSWSFTTGANGTSSNTSPTPVAASSAKSLRAPGGPSLPPVFN
ncbi:CAP domain-containing protein [Caballeronia sp. BR00000012568055]|uniref:CAP domain-containing protein n=1 Tax=Caballeronia sp. BR00000012568055 TaxID=2918761 RepID=UPI0023F65226|nr:CAP domain-containing protein [Caballeronia sp. BR00000012568055]